MPRPIWLTCSGRFVELCGSLSCVAFRSSDRCFSSVQKKKNCGKSGHWQKIAGILGEERTTIPPTEILAKARVKNTGKGKGKHVDVVETERPQPSETASTVSYPSQDPSVVGELPCISSVDPWIMGVTIIRVGGAQFHACPITYPRQKTILVQAILVQGHFLLKTTIVSAWFAIFSLFFATLCHASRVVSCSRWVVATFSSRASSKIEVWPRAQQSRQSGSPQSVQGPTPPLRQVTKPPEKVAADAIGEIQKLQAAIAALGDSSNLSRKPFELLRHELQCPQFRSVRILASSSSSVPKSVCSVRRRSTELASRELCARQKFEGEARLAKLVAEAEKIQAPPVVPPQVSELQARIDVLVSERDALRSVASVQIPGEAQRTWTASASPFRRYSAHTHLRRPGCCSLAEPTQLRVAQCNRVRGPALVAKIGGLVGQGASLLSTMRHNFPDDDERLRSAPGEGRFAPVPPVCPSRFWTISKPH